jgi:hypothetical protein
MFYVLGKDGGPEIDRVCALEEVIDVAYLIISTI